MGKGVLLDGRIFKDLSSVTSSLGLAWPSTISPPPAPAAKQKLMPMMGNTLVVDAK